MPRILILHGPNLNKLSERDPKLYGGISWETWFATLAHQASHAGFLLDVFQSNHEGALIDSVQSEDASGFIVNAAGLTHTSVSLRDALDLRNEPKAEVHFSNIYAREPFRQTSLVSGVVDIVIAGAGGYGYVAAMTWMMDTIRKSEAVGS